MQQTTTRQKAGIALMAAALAILVTTFAATPPRVDGAGDATSENIYFDGGASTPYIGLSPTLELRWAASGTGLGTKDVGITRAAAGILTFTDGTGADANGQIAAAKIGPSTSQQHTLPAVTSDTITLIGATQTLTGKTLTAPAISAPTISGAASLTGTLTGSSNGRIEPLNGITFFEDWTSEVLNLDDWSVASDAGGTPFAISVARYGTIAAAPDNETGDKEEIASEIVWTTSAVTVYQTRVKVDDIATVAFNCGLSDAKTEAATTIAWTVGASNALTTTSDDGVGFVYDTRADTDGFFGVVSAATDDKEGAGATAPVNDTWITLRFEIDASRLVTFYINGTQYGSQSTALDASTLLCPYFAVQSTTTTTRTLTVDYVFVWQAR